MAAMGMGCHPSRKHDLEQVYNGLSLAEYTHSLVTGIRPSMLLHGRISLSHGDNMGLHIPSGPFKTVPYTLFVLLRQEFQKKFGFRLYLCSPIHSLPVAHIHPRLVRILLTEADSKYYLTGNEGLWRH